MSGKREKLGVIAVVVLMSLCMVAIAISIRVTKTLIDKKQQIVRSNTNAAELTGEEESYKEIDNGRLTDFILNYNGKRVTSIKAFISPDNDIFISFDALLEELGVEFDYFPSDDILLAQLADEQITIKLGEAKFLYGDKEYELSLAPVSQKNQILVPLDLFDHIKGFGTNVSYIKGTSFLYYYPDYNVSADSEPFFFTFDDNGSAQITDVSGKQLAVVNEDKSSEKSGYSLQTSGDGNTLALKLNDKIYITSGGSNLYKLNIDINAVLSYNGDYFYWIDEKNETAYIYNIHKKEVKSLGDFYTKIDSGNNAIFDSSKFNILYYFTENSNSTVIVLTDGKRSKYYAYVQNKGEVIVAGKAKLSQDKSCLLYVTDNISSVLDLNSFNITNLGETNADWISNKLILLSNAEFISVIDKDGNNGGMVDEIYEILGMSMNSSDGIFYAGVSEIFYENLGATVKLPYLNIDYDYFTGGSSQGPFIAVSTINNSVFLLKDNTRLRLGSAKKMAMGMDELNLIDNYEKSIGLSPDGLHFSILSYENDMLALLIVDNNTMGTTKLTLDFSIIEVSKLNNVNLKWLSNNQIVVFNNNRAFIIDIADKVKIKKVILPWNSELKGVITAD